MSWSSLGRWSPFGRRNGASNQVTDQDFSYITPEEAASTSPSNTTSTIPRPRRETDVIVFRKSATRYPVHFPAYSITDGLLTIGAAREHAARKLEVGDPRRVRMFFKGRNLKDDQVKARDEGLRSEEDAQEILCVVGESVGVEGESGESGESEGEGVGEAAAKKKRNRNRKKKGKKGGVGGGGGGGAGTYSAISTPPPEYLPLPTGALPTPNSTSTATPTTSRPLTPLTPQTPLAKISALATTFQTFVPRCVDFLASPPADKAKREDEHKKLTETILAQVLLKLDAVETEGEEEARGKRRELVREVQGMLNRLDAVVKL